MADVGINVTSMFVRAEAGLGPGQVARAVEKLLLSRGAVLVDRQPLDARRWDDDRMLYGIAVSPAMAGWILVADTERKPSHELADLLAGELASPVAISSLYEILDPPEPQHNVVYGVAASDDGQYPCLYEVGADRYEALAHPGDSYFPGPPFDPSDVVFLTFRTNTIRDHYRSWEVRPVVSDTDPPF